MKRRKPTTNGHGEEPEGFLNMRETAAKLKVPISFMTRVKKEGAPFCNGKTRPEWIVEWARKTANDDARRKSCCRECVYYRPSNQDDSEEG